MKSIGTFDFLVAQPVESFIALLKSSTKVHSALAFILLYQIRAGIESGSRAYFNVLLLNELPLYTVL